MQKRILGYNGPTVSVLSGRMRMSEFSGATDDAEGIQSTQRAFELGITLLDTADMYGPYKNEEFVGRALTDRREKAFIESSSEIFAIHTIRQT